MALLPVLFLSILYTASSQSSVRNTANRSPVENKGFPLPPFNLTAKTVYVDNEIKILQTTINWDFEPDERRTGFYLKINAIGEPCKSRYSGGYVTQLPPEKVFYDVPVEEDLGDEKYRSLEVLHDCTYNISLRSVPYPANQPDYAAQLIYTVPTCINGRCNCASHQPPDLKEHDFALFRHNGFVYLNISWVHPEAVIEPFRYSIVIKKAWDYVGSEEYEDEQRDFDIESPPLQKPKKKKQELSVSSIKGQAAYSVASKELEEDTEYKVEIFAKNSRHLCERELAKWTIMTNAIKDDESPKSRLHQDNIDSSKTSNDVAEGPENTTAILITAKVLDGSSSIWAVTLAWISIAAATLLICTACFFLLRRYCFMYRKSEIEKSSIIPWAMAHSSHSMLETNILYRRAVEVKSKKFVYEIPSTQIQVGAVIGQGAFGMVCMGTVMGLEGFGRPTTVAVKQLNANAEEFQRSEFAAEIEIMKQVARHPNIVAMYGYCIEPSHQCMIMEYVPFGDLKHYLQGLRKQFDMVVYNMKNSIHKLENAESPSTSLNSSFINANEKSQLSNDSYYLDPAELQSFGLQVANGMAHIESLGIIHRDLAARNILVGRGKQLKISDFGLSRRGVYVKTSKGIIPLRWLSIEAIEQNVYSTKSDVWAYGVVLWEICTLAGFPYANVIDKELLKYLKQGNRLEKPSSCSNEVYDIMTRCWAEDADERPSFSSLCEYLSDLNSQECPYVEFLPDEELPPPEISSDCGTTETPSTLTTEVCQSSSLVTATA